MFKAQHTTRVCDLLMAQGHTCYCALVRGPHVEKQQHVVHSSTEITVMVLWYIHSAEMRPRAAGWRHMAYNVLGTV